MNLYAVTYIAQKHEIISHSTAILLEESDEQAELVAYKDCHLLYPPDKGYSNHRYTLSKAPDIIKNYRVVIADNKQDWQEYARELYETLDNVLVLFIAGNGRNFDYSCVQKALELFKRGHQWWPLTLGFAQMIEEKDDQTTTEKS